MSSSIGPDEERPRKELGAIIGLYDKPVYRDWLAWWTVAWTVFAAFALAFPSPGTQRTTSLPTWIDVPLGTVVMGALFGLVPAAIRRQLRRARRARLRNQTTAYSRPFMQEGAAPAAPPPTSQSYSPPVAQDFPSPPTSPPAPPQHGSAATTQFDVLDLSRTRESEPLTLARNQLPYPVARAARVVQQSTAAKDVYEALLRAAETTSVVLGITALVWARQHRVSTPELSQLQDAFATRGVAQGHWVKALASVERPMSLHPNAMPGMANALKLGKGGSGLVADLRQFTEERNLWAHGGGPHNRVEAAERAGALLPVLERVLERSAFLSHMPWLLVNHSKFRRREADFLVQAAKAMGDHPDFELTEFLTNQPLAEDVFYIRVPDGLVDLTPLVVMRQCPTCHQREIAYADRIDNKNGVALKTFDRGHLLFEPGLVDEVRGLLDGPRPTHEPKAG